MIQMNIHGRLGNQMFQYAFMRSIMKKNNIESMGMGFKRGVFDYGFTNELDNFNIIPYKQIDKIKLSIFQKMILNTVILIEKIIEKILNRINYIKFRYNFESKVSHILSKFGIYYMQIGYTEFIPTNTKNQICIGCFESPKYFDNIREELIKEFTPRHSKLKSNLELYDKIENSNSVCISIRRGDFLYEEHKKAHYVCTPEYFEKSIKKISELIQNPTFFVFSDDVDWVKENMKFPSKVYFESGKDPVWEKLRLMYSCKHFIISNSTFSWWAQYLSRNSKKIVIAPSRWKNLSDNYDIKCDDWFFVEPGNIE